MDGESRVNTALSTLWKKGTYPEKILNLYDIYVHYFIYEYILCMFQFIYFANSFGEMDTISASEMNDRRFCNRRSKEEVDHETINVV